MNTQQQNQIRLAQKLVLMVLGIILPLGTLASSLPASANGHFSGLHLGFGSDSNHHSMNSHHDDSDNSSRDRHRFHHFFFSDDHLFERYDVFYRSDTDSSWIKDESYQSLDEAELEVHRLEHKGYFAKLVRE